jgi:hypothetical protein
VREKKKQDNAATTCEIPPATVEDEAAEMERNPNKPIFVEINPQLAFSTLMLELLQHVLSV